MFNSDFKNFLKNILNLDLDSDFIFIKNSNLKYIYINSKFSELFSISSENLLGKDDHFLISDKKLLEDCLKSDLAALKENHVISVEEAFGIKFNVLKIKISIGNNEFGVLGFAKLKN